MKATRILPRIDQVLDELKALREVVASESDASGPEATRMSIEDYAAREHVSQETVRRWLKQGLPCVRRGRVVRIMLPEADAWTPSEERRASAAHAAHRGRRG